MTSHFGGWNTEQAIATAKAFNNQGVSCSLSYLPVRKNTGEQTRQDLMEYFTLIDGIRSEKVDADVTLKLHQFGVYASKSLAEHNVAAIVERAHRKKVFVWIDMEGSHTTEDTIAIFQSTRRKWNNVGICLQAYLKRTEQDMHRLLRKRVPMRFVKGFYRERDFKKWSEVTKNYERLLPYLLQHSSRPAIATHDRNIIGKAKRLIKRHNIKKAEFQFFKGVCDDVAFALSKEGYNVRMYVPYGHAYSFLLHGLITFDLYHQAQRLLHVKTVV